MDLLPYVLTTRGKRLMAGIKDQRKYGMVHHCRCRAINMRVDGHMAFDVQLSDRAAGDATIITDIRFWMLGE